MKIWPSLPVPEARPVPGRRLKICIASNDVPGPVHNGGIGTANLHLARTLCDAGHHVTLLYLEESFATGDEAFWKAHYREQGLEFVHLPGRGNDPGDYCAGRSKTTFVCYQWLKVRHFDIVHFHERMGIAFYSLLAKRQGLAFRDTLLCVTTHGPVWWSEPGNEVHLHEYYYLEVDHLERESVRLADVVISPSHYMLDWIEKEGWDIPKNAYVQPHAWSGEPAGAGAARGPQSNGTRPIREFVFFGRLEIRKGIDIFCDALDLVCERSAALFSVTFLGKHHNVRGIRSQEYLRQRMRNWNVPCQVMSDCNTDEALDYLCGEGRLAVMPSCKDNSPLTVMECLLHGVPFMTSDAGGTPEMIHREDRARVLFPPEVADLADALLSVLEHGAIPARLATNLDANREQWVVWHEAMIAGSVETAITAVVEPRLPFISVCIPHCDRPALLAQALASVRTQSYKDFEVIVVDDASRSAETQSMLRRLELEFAGTRWKILRQDARRGPGAARNCAARIASGEYLLFMDDDNCAKPEELEILARVAARKRKEIYVCAGDVFSGSEPPAGDGEPERRLLPLGSCHGLGLFECRFGDSNSLIRRDWFLDRGGFDERYHVPEDWLFFARAALDGVRIEVVPESLYWYRRTLGTRQDSGSRYEKDQSLLRIYQEYLPLSLRGQLAVLIGKTRYAEGGGSWSHPAESVLPALASEGRKYPAGALYHNTGMVLGDYVLCHRRVHKPGHCVFGPQYRPTANSILEVRFFLQVLAMDDCNRGTLVSLDIYDQQSASILAIQHLAIKDLAVDRTWYALTIPEERRQRLEFRVYWHGTCDLIVSKIEVFSKYSEPHQMPPVS
jgi:O-antigen biosynthesis protein